MLDQSHRRRRDPTPNAEHASMGMTAAQWAPGRVLLHHDVGLTLFDNGCIATADPAHCEHHKAAQTWHQSEQAKPSFPNFALYTGKHGIASLRKLQPCSIGEGSASQPVLSNPVL
jgi:hypothetical protein